MKFRILTLFLICLFFSCKKGRICECNTIWTFMYSNGSGFDTRIFPSDKKPYNKSLTKGQAQGACQHQSSAIQSSFTELLTDHGNDPLKPGEDIVTKCILY